jgi:hypothetical protein
MTLLTEAFNAVSATIALLPAPLLTYAFTNFLADQPAYVLAVGKMADGFKRCATGSTSALC